MVYWKSLEHRCLEAAALDANGSLSNASDVLGPVQSGRLISWMAAHDCLADPTSDRFKASVRGLLCDEIRALDLDVGNSHGDFLMALAEKCGATLDFLRIGCGYKVYDEELSMLLENLRNIRFLDIRELKIERASGVLDRLRSSKLERLSLQLYVRDTAWNELETLVEQNPTIQSIRCNIRGRTLQNETALLRKIPEHLNSTLVELELHSFTATKESLSHLIISCYHIKKLWLTGCLQFDVDTMIQVQRICNWERLELTFQVTPSRETHEALRYLPPTLLEVALDFGPSPQTSQANAGVVRVFASLPILKRIRYHSRSFNDSWMIMLLSALHEDVARGLECLDIGLCDSLTDAALDAVADRCPDLAEFYLHSDTSKYNRAATCVPLCRWFDQPIAAGLDGRNLRVLYLNYFKQLSSDFLQVVAIECSNLEELHLASVRCVCNALLECFAENCSKLHTIDVMNCWAVEDRGIIALAEKLPLVNLNVAMCLKLTNACVYVLAQCCPSLERFIYHGVPQLKRSVAVETLKRSCTKRLKTNWHQWVNPGMTVL